MPPKKNPDISSTAKITKEKVPRKRKLKEKPKKPKLKIPTVVRVKLPSIKSMLDPVKSKSKNNSNVEQSPAAKRKIELANEVALAQLVKPRPKIQPPEAVLKKKVVKKIVKKRAQKFESEEDKEVKEKKKVVRKKIIKPAVVRTTENIKRQGRKNKEPTVQSPVTKPFDTPANTNGGLPVTKTKRVNVRRVPSKRINKTESSEQESQAGETSKRKADSTSTEAPTPVVKRKYVKKKVVNQDANSDITPDNQRTPERVTVKKKGKSNVIDSTSAIIQSPSILDDASINPKNIVDRTDPNTESEILNPSPVDSRKTSTSECLSWTKDISSSSTTTCLSVGSNDFVRIDKKVPVIKLSHVENEWKNMSAETHFDDSDSESRSSKDSCSSSSSSSSSSNREGSRRSLNLSTSSLNLSTSSVSPNKSNISQANSTQSISTKDNDWEYSLQKLSANLKKLDVEAISWIGYENRNIVTKLDIIQDKVFKLLKFENYVLKDVENIDIANIFKAKNVTQTGSTAENNNSQNNEKTTNIEPNSYTSRSEDDENFTTSKSKYVMFDQNCAEEEDPLQVAQVCCNKSSEEDVFAPEILNYIPFEANDDDDTLSLFAESITGIESSRGYSSANSNCANASEYEEYIPQPIPTLQLYNTTKYVPTKISENEPTQNLKSKTVCEKQNADSTSIYRENKNKSQSNNKNLVKMSSPIIEVPNRPAPKTINDLYKPVLGVKSQVFRGLCFYNLISNCKKIRCTFPHIQPEKQDIKSRLSNLNNDSFIEEYMMLRNWPDLRRRYGICYVSECIERKLTRLLVEMTIDFIAKAKLDSAEDTTFKVNTMEKALMYLNSVDLSECDDLLQHDFGRGILLCDVLMQTIGETQNFSRFKAVFVKLTSFITGIGRTIQLSVANQILERVCILPCEEALAYAVLAIIKNTDSKIFENSMMSQFEKLLSSLDLVLYGTLCTLRERVGVKNTQTSNESIHSPRISQEVDHLGLIHTDREERYTSPDTTKMDNSNKPPDDPMAQTVKIIRPSIFNHIFKSPNSSPSSDGEDKRPARFRSWRGQNHNHNPNYRQIRQGDRGGRFSRPMQRPLSRPPPMKRSNDQRNVLFGSAPPKFPRRSGQDFF